MKKFYRDIAILLLMADFAFLQLYCLWSAGVFPKPEKPKPICNAFYGYVISTAYSSSKDETDSTPFITATGERVNKKGGCAVSRSMERITPMGSKIYMLEAGKAREYEVNDRMAKRIFYNAIDIWKPSKQEALEWGRQRVRVIVL